MRIFVAGGTGALGQHLVPQLVAAGHDVTVLTRSDAKGAAVRAAGAEPVVGDALDRDSTVAAVRAARPEVVARMVLGLAQRATRLGITMSPVQINGEPGGMFRDADGALISLIGLQVDGDEIRTVRGFVNPDKIAHLGRLSPLGRRDTTDDWA
jgi:uncharacterized protein YbjT (DUF2867 family)